MKREAASKIYDRWYFNRPWSIEAVRKFAQRLKRTLRYQIYKRGGDEWEADLWAFCAFVYLNKYVGCEDLNTFLKHHPERRWAYRLVAVSAKYSDIKKRVATVCKSLKEPTRT